MNAVRRRGRDLKAGRRKSTLTEFIFLSHPQATISHATQVGSGSKGPKQIT